MKKILLVVSLILLGCTVTPKYKKDTCFQLTPFVIAQILDVTKDSYVVNVVSIISQTKQYKFTVFETEIEKNGIIAESCSKYRD